jgi:hypothetical protein
MTSKKETERVFSKGLLDHATFDAYPNSRHGNLQANTQQLYIYTNPHMETLAPQIVSKNLLEK